MASLLASALPLLGSIGSSLLPIIGDVARTAIPEIGKVIAGTTGKKLNQLSPEAKEAFCQCDGPEPQRRQQEEYYEEPQRQEDDEYGYYIDRGKIGMKPRRKKHLGRRRY